jgi:hypothetical protein
MPCHAARTPMTRKQDLFPIGLLLQDLYRVLLKVDGAFFATFSAFEEQSLTAGRQWLEGLGKEAWAIGPLDDMPSAATSAAGTQPTARSGEDTDTLAFLDKMHAVHGAHAVVFVRVVPVLSGRVG